MSESLKRDVMNAAAEAKREEYQQLKVLANFEKGKQVYYQTVNDTLKTITLIANTLRAKIIIIRYIDGGYYEALLEFEKK